MKTILILLAALVVAGCATDKDYAAYLAAQSAENQRAMANQKPLVKITAQPGVPITGLESVEVYAPTSAPVVQQARANEWAGVAQTALGVVGTVAGIRAAGQAAVGLADSVGRAGTAGYDHVQATGAVTNTTIGANSGAGSGTISSANQANSTVGNNSGAGSGASATTIGANSGAGSGTVGDYSGSQAGNNGLIAGGQLSTATATPTVVQQAPPVIVPPAVIPPGKICTVGASGVFACQ